MGNLWQEGFDRPQINSERECTSQECRLKRIEKKIKNIIDLLEVK